MEQKTASTDRVTIIEDTSIRPFRVEVPQEALDNLRRRIEATRLPSKELVEDRSQGVQLATIQELATYWTTEYDFGRVEARRRRRQAGSAIEPVFVFCRQQVDRAH